MDKSRIRKKKLRFHNFPDTCRRGLSDGSDLKEAGAGRKSFPGRKEYRNV